MRGYDRDAYEDLDEYEEDGEELEEGAEGEEYEEEEEDPKLTREELEYLELRQRLKESIRKQMKKEGGSASNKSQEKNRKLPYDNYGSFFGPSKPVIAQRVIQESKSLLENQHLTARVSNSHQPNKKSSSLNNAGSKAGAGPHQPRPKVINEIKVKAQKLKDTRDYSFLLSDDAALPPPTKAPPARNVSNPESEARSVQLPQRSKHSSSNISRQIPNDRDGRKHVAMNGKMQPRPGSHNTTSTDRPKLTPADSRKQFGSSAGNGPGRPVGPKVVTSKAPVARLERKISAPVAKYSLPAAKNSRPGLNNSLPSKSTSSIQKQPLQQKKEYREPSQNIKPKQRVESSKPQMNKPVKQISSRSSLQEHRPKKKPARQYSDDEDPEQALSMIRKMFGYNPRKYNDDDDDSDMEANFNDIMEEEMRSARIAKREDEIELQKIEEEERREHLRKEAKKRKLSQR